MSPSISTISHFISELNLQSPTNTSFSISAFPSTNKSPLILTCPTLISPFICVFPRTFNCPKSKLPLNSASPFIFTSLAYTFPIDDTSPIS